MIFPHVVDRFRWESCERGSSARLLETLLLGCTLDGVALGWLHCRGKPVQALASWSKGLVTSERGEFRFCVRTSSAVGQLRAAAELTGSRGDLKNRKKKLDCHFQYRTRKNMPLRNVDGLNVVLYCSDFEIRCVPLIVANIDSNRFRSFFFSTTGNFSLRC